MPDDAFKLALDRLRNAVADLTDAGKNDGSDIAYALYVLARNGIAPIGDLRYLADAKLDKLNTPIAKAQIAPRSPWSAIAPAPSVSMRRRLPTSHRSRCRISSAARITARRCAMPRRW